MSRRAHQAPNGRDCDRVILSQLGRSLAVTVSDPEVAARACRATRGSASADRERAYRVRPNTTLSCCPAPSSAATITMTTVIKLVIEQRRRNLGGAFEVGRVLPFAKQRMVGPFVFFDHMGPIDLVPGVDRSVDVRPHPHIGLSTVT
jgi:hypothetical protein